MFQCLFFPLISGKAPCRGLHDLHHCLLSCPIISTGPWAGCNAILPCAKRGEVEGVGAIVCCVDDCGVAMEKLETSGEFVFCWAGSQPALTYYNCESE